jgi:hypothetical protein
VFFGTVFETLGEPFSRPNEVAVFEYLTESVKGMLEKLSPEGSAAGKHVCIKPSLSTLHLRIKPSLSILHLRFKPIPIPIPIPADADLQREKTREGAMARLRVQVSHCCHITYP